MEHQKIETMAKKIWHIVRVAFFMLRKGVCKRKILVDLNMMMKRGKLAGKSLRNLMFHHHHSCDTASNPEEYEFSCSNTPLHRRYLNKIKKSSRHDHGQHDLEAVNKVLEMIMMSSSSEDVAASPAFPVTSQLRITDSPFPLQNGPEEDSGVDEKAEDFINKFYSQLKKQKYY